MASLQELYAVSKAMGADKRAANPLSSGMDAFGSGVSQGYGQDSGMDRAYKIMQIKNAADQIKKRQEDLQFKQIEMDLKKQELDIKKQEAKQQGELWNMYSKQFGSPANPETIKTEQGKIAQMVDTGGKRTAEMANEYQNRPELDITATSSGKIVPKLKAKKALPKPTQSGVQTTAIVDGQIVPVEPYNKEKASVVTPKADHRREITGLINAGASNKDIEKYLEARGYQWEDFERLGILPKRKAGSDFTREQFLPSNVKKTSEAVQYIMRQHGKTEEEARAILRERYNR